MKHIIIIGGGFGGVNLAKALGNKEGFRITLVDRNNYNFFPPLLYQVATTLLEPDSITYPFRKLFRRYKNIQFRLGEFEEIIPAEKKIILSSGELYYDEVVFATGAATNYFSMNNVKANALPMKTVNDAIELRNHFLETIERASVETNEAERKKMLTVVIAGGGPTGVEVSGMLANLRNEIAPKDYPEMNDTVADSHIYLVTGGDKVLEPMSKKSQQNTYKALIKMGVEIKFGHQVKDYKDDVITFENGEAFETKTVVWAAGVSPMVLKGIPETSYGKGKRLSVD